MRPNRETLGFRMVRREGVWRTAKRRFALPACAACLTAGIGCTDGVMQVWTQRGSYAPAVTSPEQSGEADTGVTVGETSVEQAVSTAAWLLVDDFEDGDTRAASGLGWWYTQSDTTGEQTLRIETAGDAERGAFSAHYSGFGFQVWGAMLGLDFTPDEGHLDARDHEVLHFRARVGGGSITQVSARLLDPEGQHSRELELTTEWREFELPFAELVAVDGGEQPLDASRLTQFHLFIFSADYFDLWLDDFGFR